MPLGTEGRHVALHDGLVTALAAGGKLLVVALSAEGFAVLLMEAIGSEVLAAERAEKVLWVPGLVQGTHHPLRVEIRRRKEVINLCSDVSISCRQKVVFFLCVDSH